jgi:sugar phosphate isomerase/epimerase
VQNFLVPEKDDALFKANLAEARATLKPIKTACCFLPADLKCVGLAIDEPRLLKYAETAFKRAEEAGIEIIVFGSGGARTVPEGYDMARAMDDFVNILQKLGPIAAKHGILVVVEPLNKTECNLITSLAEGADAVTRANHASVMLLADYFHMLKDGEPASEIVRFGSLIKHTHVSELAGRAAPGTSREDFQPFFDALDQINYKGRLSIEAIWTDIAAQVEPSIQYLRA